MRMKKLMSARGCAVSDAARQRPAAALVDYLVTADGLAGFEQDLTLRLNAFGPRRSRLSASASPAGSVSSRYFVSRLDAIRWLR